MVIYELQMGSEYRTFLLFIGMVAFKDYISQEEYQHFSLLCCATILCTSKIYRIYAFSNEQNQCLADDLFERYIEYNIYGEHTIGSNVHNLCHVANDVRRFSELGTTSTYPFENCLGMMKEKLQTFT